MRKRTPRKVRPAVSPCLIAVGMNNKHEAGMIAAVQAFRRGYATVDNFLDLCDSRDITVIAYQMQKRHVDGMEAAMDATHTALMNIRDRREETGKFGASGEEAKALKALADTAMDFWARHSGALFRCAYIEMMKLRADDSERLTRKTEEACKTANVTG